VNTELLACPEWLPRCEEHMSNCDHKIDEGMEEKLRSGQFLGSHAAWDFWGDVWFQNEQFHERVKRYRVIQGVYSADSLEELMEKVNNKFGWK
jgi:hypothetical protein